MKGWQFFNLMYIFALKQTHVHRQTDNPTTVPSLRMRAEGNKRMNKNNIAQSTRHEIRETSSHLKLQVTCRKCFKSFFAVTNHPLSLQ